MPFTYKQSNANQQSNAMKSFQQYTDEFEYSLPERKTRKDVLTPIAAICSKKSSKNHKLKPRAPSRDITKMKDAKKATINRKGDRMSCL